EDENVNIDIHAAQVKFRYGSSELVTQIINGKFPDYMRVIETKHDKNIVLDHAELLASLQRAAILSNEKFGGVRWILASKSLRVSCTNNEQEEAQEEMEIDYAGDALDIGFNITYILDVLNNVQTDKVVCSFGDASSSMLVTVPGKDNFRYVVMPMRI
ncbi:MAG: DNA polymerase III subunit beta, partial [Betaproteobacteria bacterium]